MDATVHMHTTGVAWMLLCTPRTREASCCWRRRASLRRVVHDGTVGTDCLIGALLPLGGRGSLGGAMVVIVVIVVIIVVVIIVVVVVVGAVGRQHGWFRFVWRRRCRYLRLDGGIAAHLAARCAVYAHRGRMHLRLSACHRGGGGSEGPLAVLRLLLRV